MSFVENRSEGIPENLQNQLESQHKNLDSLLAVKPYLPEAIKAISDQFVVLKKNQTPWDIDGAFDAYFFYFHVLNTVRFVSALRHLKTYVPNLEVQSAMDIGSGLGSVTTAFQSIFPKQSPSWTFVESSVKAKRWHEKIFNDNFDQEAVWRSAIDPNAEAPDIFFASYSLNEIETLPQAALEAKHLVIVEPSHQTFSRNLMALRNQVVDAGFQILAPCTHHEACPLLTQSKHDFCHDRIHFEAPTWFEKIEAKLPMKNRSLTFSYLVASKEAGTVERNSLKARIIGDTLKEKGKTRQAVCRGPEREFLSWLKRDGKAPYLNHGSLVELKSEPEKKGNELRVGKQTIQILETSND